MEFKTLLVQLDTDPGCTARIRMVADLAQSVGGHVLGVSATGFRLEPFRAAGEEAGRYIELARRRLLAQTAAAGQLLGTTIAETAPGVGYSHHVMEDEPGWVLAHEGRLADVIVMTQSDGADSATALAANTADYVLMNAGRPILVVPREFRRLHGGHVVIAWDGSREAARAVKDALPLLRRAGQVTVAAVADDRATAQAQAEAVAGLQAYLGRHGIGAMARMEQSGEAVGPVLLRITRELAADMIVAGGYGHSRVRELVMGGTTRTLMRRAEVPLFLSH